LLSEVTPRLTRDQKQAQTRSDLIVAASGVIARRGYAGASVEEIADSAGYSQGAVYSNFESKADLFLAVFEERMADRVRRLEERRELAEGDFSEQARVLADYWMRSASEDREGFLLELELTVQAARDPELSARFAARGTATKQALETWIAAHEEEASVRFELPASDLAIIMSALGLGLATEALNEPGAIRPELFGEFAEFLFRVLEERATLPRAGRGSARASPRGART
jgi:AcrR family transcriptional regulator